MVICVIIRKIDQANKNECSQPFQKEEKKNDKYQGAIYQNSIHLISNQFNDDDDDDDQHKRSHHNTTKKQNKTKKTGS